MLLTLQHQISPERLAFFSFEMAIMADQHNAVARGDAKHRDEADERAEGEDASGEQRGCDSADERERQAHDDQRHQAWSAEIGA